MHEMPFTQALLDMALEAASGRTIRRIRLRAGRLSAVDPEAVSFYFDHLSQGTLAEGALLAFDVAPIELTCRSCGATTAVPDDARTPAREALADALRAGCPCGRAAFTVTGGLGFDLADVEVA
jgi:hydrogenase nickel incorporation protein HypA/HybF